jgi:hypothetical protein
MTSQWGRSFGQTIKGFFNIKTTRRGANNPLAFLNERARRDFFTIKN